VTGAELLALVEAAAVAALETVGEIASAGGEAMTAATPTSEPVAAGGADAPPANTAAAPPEGGGPAQATPRPTQVDFPAIRLEVIRPPEAQPATPTPATPAPPPPAQPPAEPPPKDPVRRATQPKAQSREKQPEESEPEAEERAKFRKKGRRPEVAQAQRVVFDAEVIEGDIERGERMRRLEEEGWDPFLKELLYQARQDPSVELELLRRIGALWALALPGAVAGEAVAAAGAGAVTAGAASTTVDILWGQYLRHREGLGPMTTKEMATVAGWNMGPAALGKLLGRARGRSGRSGRGSVKARIAYFKARAIQLDVAREFARQVKKAADANPSASAQTISEVAHKETAAYAIKKYEGVVPEPEAKLGISTGLSPEGPRTDVMIWNEDVKVIIELKKTAWVKDGRLMTPRMKVEGAAYTTQTQAHEIFAEDAMSGEGFIVCAANERGEVFTYHPDIKQWVKETF